MNIGDVLKDDGGTWYTVPGADDVKVKIKRLKPKVIQDMTRQCTAPAWDGARTRDKTDDVRLQDMLLDAMVVEWKGILENDKPLECTLANKKRLNENWTEFAALWNKVFAGGQELDGLRAKDLEKN